MGNKKRILIIGAGYAGILAAKKLSKKFNKDDEINITIVDKNPFQTLRTELHEVVAGRVEERAIRIDLKKIFKKRKVNVVLDEIKVIDFDKQIVKSEQNIYQYEYLLIGVGSQPTFFGIKGAKEHVYPLWNYNDAVNLKEHILHMFRGAIKERDKEKRKKMLTFVVVGGGFTGVEMMGELGEWKDQLCEEFYSSKDDVKLYLVHARSKILPIYPNHLIEKAEKRFNKLGVEIITGAKVTEVSKDSVVFGENSMIDSYTVIWAAGVEGVDLVGSTAIKQQGRKRIITNDKLQTLEYKNVYVVGDNIFYIVEGEERPVPQMVENAENSAALVVNNIYKDIKVGEKKAYKPVFHGSMVSIGSRYGLAYLNVFGKNIVVYGGLAMFIKHFVNLIYFFQVAGINKCWSYLLQEFVNIKDNRSFLGGHFTKVAPNFWLVPLRILLGVGWFQHGVSSMSIGEIGVGVCLSFGLFTTISSLVSIIMIGMFSGLNMTEYVKIWYSVGSVALMGGAGRTFGLDYYVLPVVKRIWWYFRR